MALPNGDIANTTYSEQFLAPRDRVFTRFSNWERGGIGLSNATSGLDVYDWFYRCDKATGAVYASVPGVIAEQLVYTISPLPREFMGSFDTNMRPILAWRDVTGAMYLRWFDPVANNTVNTLMPSRSHSPRVAIDDVRIAATRAAITDTIFAYVRFNKAYYRVLRERFQTEHLISAGFPLLFQIGMSNLFRFQFARSPVVADQEPEINFKRPANRAGKIAGFDDFGDEEYYDFVDQGVEGDPGIPNSVDKFVVTSNGQLIFLRRPATGVWENSTVEVRVDFYLDDVDLRATRTFQFNVSREGYITRTQTAADGEVGVAVVEKGVGTRTYTLTAYTDYGRGITFHLLAAQGLPTTGDFLPQYNADGDFYGGGFVPTGRVHYADYGTHVSLSMTDTTGNTSRSVSTRMRWGAGSLPAPLRPYSARSVPCLVSHDGVTVDGTATFNTDGSAEFWPLVVSSTRLVAGTFTPTSDQPHDKGLPNEWQITFAKSGPTAFFRIPTLSDISPDFAARFTSSQVLTVTGVDFATYSVIRVNGVDLATTYDSPTQLHATIPGSSMLVPATHTIKVFTTTPGGGLSAGLPFEVRNPAPVLTLLDPDLVIVGEPDTDITITGTGFVPESIAYLDGVAMTTVYVNSTTLTATVPTSGILTEDVRDVTVVNVAPGGGTSNALALTLSAITILKFTSGYTPPVGDSVTLDFTN